MKPMTKHSFRIALLLVAALAAVTGLGGANAEAAAPVLYTGTLTPAPQRVLSEWQELPLDGRTVSIELTGEPHGGPKLGAELLTERLTSAGATVAGGADAEIRVIAGPINDARIRELDERHGLSLDRLVLPSEGYALRVVKEGSKTLLVAAGQDPRGIFYALATLYQQTGQVDGRGLMRIASLDDFPVWRERFFGDYGIPDRDNLIRLALYKINGYAITHRYDWRNFKEGYSNYAERLKLIKDFKEETGLIDFEVQLNAYAEQPRVNPLFDATNEDHIRDFTARFELAAAYGIRHMMVCFDDWTPMVKGAHVVPHEAEAERFGRVAGATHGYITRRVYEALKPKYPDLKLSVCPAPYSINHVKQYDTVAERQYLRDLAAALPDDVPVVWTGPVVSSPRVEREHFLEYSSYLMNQQPTFLWDNNVAVRENNREIPQAVTRFYDDFAADSHGRIYMNTFAVAKPWVAVSATSSNDYLWNPKAFDAVASHRNLVEQRFGRGSYALVESFYEAQRGIEEALESDKAGAAAALAKFDDVVARMESAGLPTKPFAPTRARYAARAQADPPSVAIRRLEGTPEIDGKLDDAAWSGAAEITAFQAMTEGQTPAHTVGRISYDDAALYLAFEARHDEPLDVPIGADYRDAPVFALADNLQVFLRAGVGAGSHVQLAFDHEGNVYDAANGMKEWDTRWDVSITKDAGVWRAEVRIPFEALMPPFDTAPRAGDEWSGNFCRSRPSAKEHSSWSSTHGSRFGDQVFWGGLRFE